LFCLGWVALLNQKGLSNFRTEQFQGTLAGTGPWTVTAQARDLMPKAELLGLFKVIIDDCMQYAAGFALIALVTVLAFDGIVHRAKVQS